MAPRKQKKPDLQMSFLAYVRWKAPLHLRQVALEMSRRPEQRRDGEIAHTLGMDIDEVKAALRLGERWEVFAKKPRDGRDYWYIVPGHWLLRIWESRGADANAEQATFHDAVANTGWDHALVLDLLQALADMGILDAKDALDIIGKGDEKAREAAEVKQAERKDGRERKSKAAVRREELKAQRARERKRKGYKESQNDDEAEVRKRAGGKAKIELEQDAPPPPPPIPVTQRADIEGGFSLADEDDNR